ncbi:MAG: tetratricopeptide repeat protein [Hyphococcus sp.]
MANEDSALREVDQELAEERQWATFRKYGPAAIAGAAAIVIGVAGSQVWDARQTGAAKDQALEFRSALELLSEDQTAGRAALQVIADTASSGYGELAAMHRAASFARGGERLAAIAAYREIYNGGAERNIRELARLRAAYLSLSDGREDVLNDLGDLPQNGGSYAYHAREVAGLAALKAKDYETALSMFRELSIDLGAPPALRERAENFAALTAAGKAGVNVTGETQLDDLLSAVGLETNTPISLGDADDDSAGEGPDQTEDVNTASDIPETIAPEGPDGSSGNDDENN